MILWVKKWLLYLRLGSSDHRLDSVVLYNRKNPVKFQDRGVAEQQKTLLQKTEHGEEK